MRTRAALGLNIFKRAGSQRISCHLASAAMMQVRDVFSIFDFARWLALECHLLPLHTKRASGPPPPPLTEYLRASICRNLLPTNITLTLKTRQHLVRDQNSLPWSNSR